MIPMPLDLPYSTAPDLAGVLALLDQDGADLLTDEENDLVKEDQSKRGGWTENLAEKLDDNELARIATLVTDGYEADEESRADWREREKLGIRLLGISENADGEPAFDGASRAVHPGLIEAVVQFQARAIAELWQPEGPCKTLVEGQATSEKDQQAKRVMDYLNWLYTTRMPGAYQQHDRLLFRLPLSGSGFKKIYHDELVGCVVARYVPAEDLIVPYGATDLLTTPRITQLLKLTGYDIQRLMEAGVYRQTELLDPVDDLATNLDDALQEELDAVTSTKSSPTQDNRQSDRYVFLEQSVILDIDGEPKASPFLVTMDRESEEILAIYRDWREDDPRRQRIERFVHYPFLPGLDGFYCLGLLHVVGRLAEALSGNLRALLDSATLANLRGGFRSADVRLPGAKSSTDGLTITPGEWLPVDATAEELQKLFVQIPYGEPSQTLFNLLQYLDQLIRRVSGTTEDLVGDNTKSVPVGTTLARIEQGLKVQTAIQMRLHRAQQKELQLVVERIAEHGPDPAYCRDVLGMTPEQFAADFDSRVDVRPVSDPNAVTATQRMVIAQALVDMASQNPDLFDRREVYRRLLETMRVAEIDTLMPAKGEAPHMGPVEENMALVTMQPVRAYPDQDHTAHGIVHQTWLAGLDPETLKRVQATAVAHIAEHQAWAYYLQMQQAMGMQLPAAPMGQPVQLTPEQENMLAMMAAQAAQLMAQQQPPPPVDPAAAQAAAKAESEQAKVAADIRRQDALAAATVARDDAQAIAKMQRGAAEQEAKLIGKYMSEAGQRGLEQEPIA